MVSEIMESKMPELDAKSALGENIALALSSRDIMSGLATSLFFHL